MVMVDDGRDGDDDDDALGSNSDHDGAGDAAKTLNLAQNSEYQFYEIGSREFRLTGVPI